MVPSASMQASLNASLPVPPHLASTVGSRVLSAASTTTAARSARNNGGGAAAASALLPPGAGFSGNDSSDDGGLLAHSGSAELDQLKAQWEATMREAITSQVVSDLKGESTVKYIRSLESQIAR